jgi:hypothetical protein
MSSAELGKQRSHEQLKKQQTRDDLQRHIMGCGGGGGGSSPGTAESTPRGVEEYSTVVGRMRAASIVQHTGYLVKQGDLMPTWKRRFFVLESKRLRWYGSEDVWKAGKKPKGELTVVAVYRNAEDPEFTGKETREGESKEHGVRPKVVVHSLEGRLMLVRADEGDVHLLEEMEKVCLKTKDRSADERQADRGDKKRFSVGATSALGAGGTILQ